MSLRAVVGVQAGLANILLAITHGVQKNWHGSKAPLAASLPDETRPRLSHVFAPLSYDALDPRPRRRPAAAKQGEKSCPIFSSASAFWREGEGAIRQYNSRSPSIRGTTHGRRPCEEGTKRVTRR